MAGPVFVTGGSGFVGAHLLRRLQEEGRGVRALLHSRPVDGAGASETVAGDLGRPETYRTALDGVETIVHAGALLDPVPDGDAAEAINHRATVRLAQAARDAGARTFVFISSMAAIGFRPGAGLLGPDAPCAPTSAYGRSKRHAERALSELDPGAMRVVILRPPTVYGPGERRNFLALTRAIASGFFIVPGDGTNRMSFCHVGNLVEAVSWAIDRDRARGILHVSEPPIRFRDAVERIAGAVGKRPLPLPFPLPAARAAARGCELTWAAMGRNQPPLSRSRLTTLTSDCALDIRDTQALGFEPPVDFDRGVAETVAWYRREGLLS